MSNKLLVADDHEVVRAGLKSLLSGTDIKVTAEAATGEAALRLALKHNPDIVLLDVRMPDGDGLVALQRIKLEKPELPVLVWSAFENPTYVAWMRGEALGAVKASFSNRARRMCSISAIRMAAKGEPVWRREQLRFGGHGSPGDAAIHGRR